MIKYGYHALYRYSPIFVQIFCSVVLKAGSLCMLVTNNPAKFWLYFSIAERVCQLPNSLKFCFRGKVWIWRNSWKERMSFGWSQGDFCQTNTVRSVWRRWNLGVLRSEMRMKCRHVYWLKALSAVCWPNVGGVIQGIVSVISASSGLEHTPWFSYCWIQRPTAWDVPTEV